MNSSSVAARTSRLALLAICAMTICACGAALDNAQNAPIGAPKVDLPVLVVATAALPNGTVSARYDFQLRASGGPGGPLTWTATSLPPGLDCGANGAIGGIPTLDGVSHVSVSVVGVNGEVASRDLDLIVTAQPPAPLAVATTSLPDGIAGQSYTATLGATGGTAPYLWGIVAGTLPPGLALNGATIDGIAAQAGQYALTVAVTDAMGAIASTDLTIDITTVVLGWRPASLTGTPVAVYAHTVIWDDVRGHAIVWGGFNSVISGSPKGVRNEGMLYDPANDAWLAMTDVNAPTARYWHDAVWTGATGNPATENRMIVWGGWDTLMQGLQSGGVYNPATDQWENKPNFNNGVGAPIARTAPGVIWTGEALFVWGGRHFNSTPGSQYRGVVYNDGAMYDLATDSWTPLPAGPTQGRSNPLCAWTGSSVILFGGARWQDVVPKAQSRYYSYGDCWLYTPGTPHGAAGSWVEIDTSSPNAPCDRFLAGGVMVGDEFFIWGGSQAIGHWNSGSPVFKDYYGVHHYLNDGAAYNLSTGQWRKLNMTGAPAPRRWNSRCPLFASGAALVVWGGYKALRPHANVCYGMDSAEALTSEGAAYDIATDTWTPLDPASAPAERSAVMPCCYGDEFLIWGGHAATSSAESLDTGAIYKLR